MRNIAISELDNFFKSVGFTRSGLIWYIKTNDIYLLCEYQGSSFAKGFYLNFGLYFSSIDKPMQVKVPKSVDWHFIGRYNRILKGLTAISSAQIGLNLTESELLESIEIVKQNIRNIILPLLTPMQNYNYFKINFPDNFDHDKLWLQNLTEKEFIDFIRSKD